MTRERTKRMPDGKIYHYIMSDAAVEKEDQAKKRWRAENYTRLTADIPKEMMQKIADAAASRRISKRQFIIEALENELKR